MNDRPDGNDNGKSALSLKLALIVYAVFSAAAFLWGFIAARPNIFVHPRPDTPVINAVELLTQVAAGLLFALTVIMLNSWASERFLWARRLESEFARLIGVLSTRDIIIMSALSGLAEELFFRGAMQPTLGLGLSTLIFGMLHIGPSRQFLPWTAFALLVGLALGWSFQESGTLAAPITAHLLINLVNMLRLRKRWYSLQTGPKMH